MKQSDLRALSGVTLFAQLTRRQLGRVRQAMTEYVYPPGRAMVVEGTTGQVLFVILEGKAKVLRAGRTINRMGPGDVFGEIAVVDGRPRSASVVAETETTCLLLHRADLRTLILEEPQIAWNLLVELAGRVRTRD